MHKCKPNTKHNCWHVNNTTFLSQFHVYYYYFFNWSFTAKITLASVPLELLGTFNLWNQKSWLLNKENQES